MSKKNTPSAGREELISRVQTALNLSTKKEAEKVTTAVTESITGILLDNIEVDGFSLKVPLLGKFSVKHVPGRLRKNPFKANVVSQTKDKRKVRFVSLGDLRNKETI